MTWMVFLYSSVHIFPVSMTVSVVLTCSSQAGLFSASLTSFVVDSKGSLKVNPTDKMVYYLEQHSTILSQISQQLASIAPQVSIPSTPPPPFPPFNPEASDIRINALWFMALTFSLSAALLAILVQQWVRDYMHVFPRYSDPLKCARVRQYLYEGSDGWSMPRLAEAVPGLLHVSLFLFFAGLAVDTLNINTTIGLSTTILIGICGMLYMFTTIAPVIYPQSPYQNSFSAVIWYAMQKARCRIFKDLDGKSKIVSANLAQGQMQLSMEETEERKARDVRALRWLLDNVTEGGEIESFTMSIPGSFNGKWSFEVWTELSKFKEDDVPLVAQPSSRSRRVPNVFGLIAGQSRTSAGSRHGSPPNTITHRQASRPTNIRRPVVTTSIHETNTIREVCGRIAHLFDTCKNRGVFASDELWRRRTRACVEATASLVCYADADIHWFGDLLQILGDIGNFEEIRRLSMAGKEPTFVARWTCLSITAIRANLSDNTSFKAHAKSAVASFEELGPREGTSDEMAEQNAQEVEKTMESKFREHEQDLSVFLRDEELITDGVKAGLKAVKFRTDSLYETIDGNHRITQQLPGIYFDLSKVGNRGDELSSWSRDFLLYRFISSQQLVSDTNDLYRYAFDNSLSRSEYAKLVIEKIIRHKNLLQRQLWRLQDVRDGGGLGFAVELFLLALKQLLSTLPSQESYSALYIGTLKAITSDWSKYKHSVGTQKILLDAIAADHGFLCGFNYPEYITDELWDLLGNILEGQAGPHITSAVQHLTDRQLGGYKYGARAEEVISRLRAS